MLRSVQTIAFNLPNDERVRKEKGAKKVRGIINLGLESLWQLFFVNIPIRSAQHMSCAGANMVHCPGYADDLRQYTTLNN